ncbi:YrhC family protein [Bacillus sp. cl95]|uniref:YrhC family protein n=2 Tax=unclassified Bacillus (in: firmicutes) TaxID=185979 RepID=UPI0020C8EE25|nr:YrhC family protein [Bacillus sp. cl95]
MMNFEAKILSEKMADYKRFAIVLLSVGVFFYLGIILPSVTNSTSDINIMMGTSVVSLTLSIFFFFRSKHYKNLLQKLGETD